MSNQPILRTMTLSGWRDTFKAAFRRHVGHGAVSVRDLAEALDVSPSLVEKWQNPDNDKTPCGRDLMRLCAILGDNFTNEVLAFAGKTGARDSVPAQTCLLHVVGELGHTIRMSAEALEDGHFDESERFEIARKLREFAAYADGIEAAA